MTVTIRPAAADDALPLSVLAEATFRETFGDANTPEDMALHAASAYGEGKQASEIADPSHVVLLAEHTRESGATTLIGYADLILGSAAECVAGPAPAELSRIYVSRAWHGQGAAQVLLDAVIAAARDRRAQTLWLGVWERNPRAVAFYQKHGFTRVGEHLFKLGADQQTDWILARNIG